MEVYRRAHKRLYPDADEDRFTQSLMILLSPPLATRGLERLGRPLLETWHPLALATTFGRKEEATQLSRRILKELTYPRPSIHTVHASQVAEIERTWRELQAKPLRQLLRAENIDPEVLLKPPIRLEECCRSYCPRCDTQFTTATGECPDCGGVPLQPLPDRPPQS
jgi:hypothetical protein